MTVWTIASVADEPETTLRDWRVLELPNGDRHLVGHALEAREGRASSRVAEFDPRTLRAVTSSGRVYALQDRPGHDSDADYVWRRWMRINDAASFEDVSRSVWEEHLRRTSA